RLQEVVEVVNAAKLMTEVATTAARIPIPAAKPAVVAAVSTYISAAKPKVLKIVHAAPTVLTRKRKGGKTYDQIRPIFQARFDANMRFLLKSKEEMEKEEEEIIKSINETPVQKAAKRRRLREQAKEARDLKKQLEVVADEDDDVFVEATPIGTKVPVVNYEIVMVNNKPREDLEDLWKIMKARFSTSKPTNFTDDYLLVTLKNMFEK
nr:hypothetical protein [Tanacetum cinerariifolium]